MNPDRKVTVGIAVGGFVAFAAWAIKAFGGPELSAEAAVGLSAALTFIVQYVVPNKETPSV